MEIMPDQILFKTNIAQHMITTNHILCVLKPIQRGFLAAVVLTVLSTTTPVGLAGIMVPWFGIIDGTNEVQSYYEQDDFKGLPFHYHNQAVEISTPGGKGTQFSEFDMTYEYRDGEGLYAIAEGKTEHTTANGDLIFNDFVLVQLIANLAWIPLESPLACEGTYTVTGGTGRFASASGKGCLWGYDLGDGRVVLLFDGTISAPGANKRKGGGHK
jgi:hypothetical protein